MRKPNNPLKYCWNTKERSVGKHFKLSYSHFYPDKFSVFHAELKSLIQ